MRSFLNFLEDDRGSETIQFVSWIPLFMFLLILVTDASFMYLTHTEMTNVARDTARRLSTGAFTTTDEAEKYAKDELTRFDHVFTVTAAQNPDSAVGVEIRVPIRQVMVFGNFIGVFPILGDDMVATVVMRADPNLKNVLAMADDGGSGGGKGKGQ